MRLYHASDLHVTEGCTVSSQAPWAHRLAFKLANGMNDMSLHRHTRLSVEAMVLHFEKRLRQGDRDWHLLLTGDLTDAGSTDELKYLKGLLAPIWDPDLVTAIPGNHDTSSILVASYAREKGLRVPAGAAARRAEFEACFGELMTATHGFPRDTWPFVKVLPRGRMAIIGLDSTFEHGGDLDFASGRLGADQLDELGDALERLQRSKRFAGFATVVALHHSPIDEESWKRQRMLGLRDSAAFLAACEGNATCILNGHNHSLERSTSHGIPILQAPTLAFGIDEEPKGAALVVGCYDVHLLQPGRVAGIEELEILVDPAIRIRQLRYREKLAHLLRKPLPCDTCNGPVAPEMDVCPWCQAEPPVDFKPRGAT